MARIYHERGIYLSREQWGEPSRTGGMDPRRGPLSGLRKFRKMQRYGEASKVGAVIITGDNKIHTHRDCENFITPRTEADLILAPAPNGSVPGKRNN